MPYSGIKKIILLEDSLEDQIIIKGNLYSSGIFAGIACCDNKQDYIHCLKHTQPDIILLDYHVPSFDFDEALKMARNAHENVPVIYVTGIITKELASEVLVKGADALVTKDCLEELPTVVQSLWLNLLMKRAPQEASKKNLSKKLEYIKLELNSLIKNNQICIKAFDKSE
ncbi:response regulator [Chondrinema litorale]|uniref:response regulator n=1 Tax=Chondrinema litorale TaxID=2994555 RepID=UPI002542EC2D|nr:response regulator [Chondrinema litorale]UZR96447.1 response regulator [Chondrinema litorale]